MIANKGKIGGSAVWTVLILRPRQFLYTLQTTSFKLQPSTAATLIFGDNSMENFEVSLGD